MLVRMSSKQSEVEGRLDDMLSRIAMETQEIRELEQQLTDGQILVNESLQKDLEKIICGLQEYLKGLREQARRSQQQVQSLQTENQSLQLHLEDTLGHCRQLEDRTRTLRRDVCVQQEELSVLRMKTRGLRDRRVESSRQQAELQQLREELTRQTVRQNVCQDEDSSLQQDIQTLQTHLDQTKAHLHQTRTQNKDTGTHVDQTRLQLDQITAAMMDPQEVQSGPEQLHEDKYSPVSPEDMLSRSVEQLYRAIQQTRTRREQLQQNQNHSQEQMDRLQAQLVQDQDHIAQLEAQLVQDQDHISQLEAQVAQDQDQVAQLKAQVIHGMDQDQEPDWRLKEDLETLRVRLQRNRHVQYKLEAELQQSGLKLQDVQQERDMLLQQLRSQSDGHQRSLGRLNRKLRQLSRSMCDSDQLTAEQLTSTSEQLRALNTMVEQIDGSFHRPEGGERSEHTVDRTQRHRRRQKLDRTRTRTRSTRTRDPGHTAPSLASLGTQDSGLGLQYLSSPERGQPTGGGYRVYVAPTHTDPEWKDSGGGSDADRSCRGWTPPPPPPPPPSLAAAVSAGQTPLVGPAWLLCNIPEHRDTGDRCVCECLHKEAERLEEEKKKLRLETKQLRHTLRQHRSVMQVCDEVECVQKTLLKRRAELREADRLLLEAQSFIHTTRDKVSSQDGASCLLEDTQHIRALQEEVEELRRRRREEEQSLRATKQEVRSREEELQQLSTKILSASDGFSVLLSDLQESHKRLDSLNIQVEQQEQRLLQRSEEHQTAVNRAEEVREEEQRLQSRVQELLSQRREEETRLITHKAELKLVLQELLVEQQALEEVKMKRTHSLQRLHKKKEQLDRMRDEVDRMRDQGDKKREELTELQQEVESHKNKTERRRTELQELQEELSRSREERSSLQEQCKQLEARRRHADRSLSAVEAELTKQREELSDAQLLQQEVVRDMTATQKQLNENSELLSLLTETLVEKKKHLQTVEQALCVG
ncbi:centriolin isoform X2 [Cebidichthys violaceus]|uniref:centriolin isoform X2 n=1 Tax=Cebidichthys violaceus TaxID=271503 RepID=UPI0035CB2DE8